MARSHGLKAKTLRRMLKKKGMKTTGKKATLMKRLHMRGGLMVGNEEGKSDADKALSAEPEFQEPAVDAAVDAAAPAASSDSSGAPMAGRRRRRSRRREEGGRRLKSRRVREKLGY